MNGQLERLRETVGRIANPEVLVVGDIMLDRFELGEVSRVSPEAPVPVVEIERAQTYLGAAANVAHGIARMGGRPKLVGIIGEDDAGRQVRELMHGIGLRDEGLLVDLARPTTTKTRVIARGQHLLRFDREDRSPPAGQIEDRIVERVRSFAGGCAGIVVSDYAKGVLTPRVVRALFDSAGDRPVFVDSNPSTIGLYAGAHTVSLDVGRTAQALGVPKEALVGAVRSRIGPARLLLKELPGRVRLESSGGSLDFDWPENPGHVAGVGDAMIAAYTVAVLSGVEVEDAAALASAVGQVAVSRPGTVAVDTGAALALAEERAWMASISQR